MMILTNPGQQYAHLRADNINKKRNSDWHLKLQLIDNTHKTQTYRVKNLCGKIKAVVTTRENRYERSIRKLFRETVSPSLYLAVITVDILYRLNENLEY